MRKFSLFCFSVVFSLSTAFYSAQISGGVTAHADNAKRTVYVAGMTAGFNLNTKGVQVVAITEFMSDNEMVSPAKEAGLLQGDKITAIEGKTVSEVEQIHKLLDACKGNPFRITVKRGNESQETSIQPKKEKGTQKYKLGVLIRDNVSGIGTITYLDAKNKRFGALGHGVYDEEGSPMTAVKNTVYDCGIVSVNKGIRGKAGELKGVFTGESNLGKAEYLNECGLYGSIDEGFDYSSFQQAEVCPLNQVSIGNAYIYSTVSGFTPKRYEISIVKVDCFNNQNKNFVIKIKDEALIAATGGIVQGMSGSPILQNGKIVGALTHVFLNDPTRGYGIGIEKMLQY